MKKWWPLGLDREVGISIDGISADSASHCSRLVYLVCLVYLVEPDQPDRPHPGLLTLALDGELRGFCQQGAGDVEVGKHDFGVSLESFVVGSFESVSFNRRTGQAAHFGDKMYDVFMGDVERIVL